MRWIVKAILYLLLSAPAFAITIPDPCVGQSPLLNLVDRPTKSDSACAVPFQHAIIEAGYAYSNLNGGASGQNYPQAELRLGIPFQNELVVLLPNYNLQNTYPHTGYTASTIGFKHEIGYNSKLVAAVEALVTVPSGGGAFGSDKYNSAINAIVAYNFNSALSFTLMLGISSNSLPPLEGGERYTSVNPDGVLTWQINNKLMAYFELYGQSKTAQHQGSGYDMDVGFLYLVFPRLELDAEYGRHVSGNLGGFNNYYGIGGSVLL